MDTQNIADAAAQLWRLWRDGRRIDALADARRPATLADGYAIQAELERVSGQRLAGWKIAATSVAGQTHIGVDAPIAGRLFDGKLRRAPARLTLGHSLMCVVEAEFAFRLGGDLPPRAAGYTTDEVMQQVAALHPAIEVPDSRFNDFAAAGGAQLAADNACADRFVLGDGTDADWRGGEVDLAEHPVALSVNGEVVTRGRGGDALGDPRAALTWLANWAAGYGGGLRAGQIVTTGVCGRPTPVAPGDRVLADFGPFGNVELDFDEAR